MGFRLNTQKLITILITSNEQVELEIKKRILFTLDTYTWNTHTSNKICKISIWEKLQISDEQNQRRTKGQGIHGHID